jgi:protein-tyrosine phosphatase
MTEIPVPAAGRLVILARPRGGEWLMGDVRAWKRAGIEHVVSTLTDDEVTLFELTAEADLCRANGIAWDTFPIEDRRTPINRESFDARIGDWADRIRGGTSLGVHCRQGIGRSGLVVVAILHELGVSLDDAIRTASEARGRPIPETDQQREWLTTAVAGLV